MNRLPLPSVDELVLGLKNASSTSLGLAFPMNSEKVLYAL
jgi:hypothetical protein